MAINVEFTGYVQETKVFSWGVIAKVTHNQVKKGADGNWETVGYDRFDVILPDGVTVQAKDRVTVVGRLKSKEFDRKDGSKGMSLEVKGLKVELASNTRSETQAYNMERAADVELPF